MNKKKELFKNTVIVAFGQICTKFISFFLLPLYTTYLSSAEFGIVDLLNTYVSLLIPIFFLQIDQAVFRFLIDVREDENKQKIYISNAFFIIIIQLISYFIFFLLFSIFLENDYKIFLATNVIMCMLSSLSLQISRGLGDNVTYSKGSLIAGGGAVILNVIFITLLHMGAIGMLCATLLSNFLCLLYVTLKRKIYKYISKTLINKKEIKTLLKYSIPLIPNAISWWIINASDRTIVSIILGVAINGVYSAANKFSSICITIYSVFNLTWTESAALHYKDKDNSQYFSELFNNTIKLFSFICLFVITIMPFAFSFFIKGKDYSLAYYQIPILMVATIFNIVVTFLGAIYISMKKSNEIAKTSIYSAIINIATHLLLIKFIGLYAASISTLIAYFSMSIYRFMDIQKYIKITIDKKFIFIFFVELSISLFLYYINNIYLNILSLLACIIIAILYNKNTIKSLILMLKKYLNKKLVLK